MELPNQDGVIQTSARSATRYGTQTMASRGISPEIARTLRKQPMAKAVTIDGENKVLATLEVDYPVVGLYYVVARWKYTN